MNWEAVSALATFLAVLVALWPIFGGELRRRKQARNLRVRLLIHLTHLRPAIARRFTATATGPWTSSPLTGPEAEPIIILEALLAQAHVLEAEEHDLVAAAYANLVLARTAPKIEPDTARNILTLVDQTIERLQRGKFLRGKMPTLPWSGEEKGA